MAKKIDKCSECGAKMVQYTHSLKSGSLVRILIKFSKTLEGINTDMANPAHYGFTTNEYNNFQKLRYWEVIEPGTITGKWRITVKGRLFLSNVLSLPVEAVTYHGKVVRFQDTLRKVDTWGLNYETKAYMSRQDYARSAKENKQKEIQEVLAI